jgi:hypothetical protein
MLFLCACHNISGFISNDLSVLSAVEMISEHKNATILKKTGKRHP